MGTIFIVTYYSEVIEASCFEDSDAKFDNIKDAENFLLQSDDCNGHLFIVECSSKIEAAVQALEHKGIDQIKGFLKEVGDYGCEDEICKELDYVNGYDGFDLAYANYVYEFVCGFHYVDVDEDSSCDDGFLSYESFMRLQIRNALFCLNRHFESGEPNSHRFEVSIQKFAVVNDLEDEAETQSSSHQDMSPC